MTDVFREIDEEIRQENYLALWKTYGPWLIVAAVLLVVAVAGYKGWEAYRHDRAVQASQAYGSAVEKLNAGKTAAAESAFESLADPGAGGYPLLATFRLAETRAKLGRTEKAVATWQRIAEADVAKPYRHLATLQGVLHAMDADGADALKQRLSRIAGGSSAFRTSAQELEALLAVKRGDTERAVDLYKGMAEKAKTPPAQRQRVQHMLALLNAD